MAKKKLTDRAVKLLKPRDKRFEVWDASTPGFGVRVSPAGRKSFIYLYRYEGLARRMTLGVYPRVSLATARTKQAKAKELLEEKCRDPGAELVKGKRVHRDSPTVNDLIEEYIEKWAKPRKRSWKEDQRQLKSNVSPSIGRKKANDVTRRDIIHILDTLVDRGAPIAANRTLAVIRKMFRFGITRDLVPHNPCEAVQAPAEEHQRDRVLSAAEINKLWKNLEGENLAMTSGIKLCLQLVLVTAQRRGELVMAQWSDFDLVAGWWTIPEGTTKNKLPHRVPLSPLALRLLKAAKKTDSELVFPNPGGTSPIRHDAVSKAVRRNEKAFGIAHFTPHDLRRTAASLMAGMGTTRVTIGKILNHVESGVTSVYDRHSYDQEKRKALNAWGRKLDRIVTSKSAGKVVQIG
jgi:integrase